MKQRPILFSTPMVQAIMEGRKTMTRRVVKPQPSNRGVDAFNDGEHPQMKCPYGQPGDVLWVRESFKSHYFDHGTVFKASWSEIEAYYGSPQPEPRWKPSIHMPKDAARIWLRVTNVRVERLHEISEEDARAEGVKRTDAINEWYFYADVYNTDSPVIAFERLWQSINGADSWNANPWVWVVEFERIEKPENACE